MPALAFTQNQNKDEYADIDRPLIYPTTKLAGPRVGITYLQSGETMLDIEKHFDRQINPYIMQIGWQFEYQYFKLPSGMAGMIEFVPMIGGLNQDIILPSANVLIGLRLAKGTEFGFGPSITPTGASFVLALGFNFTSGDVNFPVNLAFVPSTSGMRLSFLVGFNARKQKDSIYFN